MSRPHTAALVEDALNVRLERVLRARGRRNHVISHIGYGSSGGRDFARVLARVVLSRARYGTGEEDRADAHGVLTPPKGARGWRAFVSAPAIDVPVRVSLGNATVEGRADRQGHLDIVVTGHGLGPGWHEATVSAEGAEPVRADVLVVGEDITFGIVSDIDDTVITTMMPRPMLAFWNAFVRNETARRPVAGMAPLYRSVLDAQPGAPILYLSTGAWDAAPALTRFLLAHGYPLGPLLLTDWGPTNTGWFRSGREHKRSSLMRLAEDFPEITWLLVGDNGQHDPVIYRWFAGLRPERVLAIAIRQLTPGQHLLSRGLLVSVAGRVVGRGREIPYLEAPDGYGLRELLRAVVSIGDPRSRPSRPRGVSGWRLRQAEIEDA